MKAVIIAAGAGSRLDSEEPKTLLPFGDETILANILKNISKGGINEFVIVVGFQAQHIIDYLKKNDYFGFQIEFVKNDEWKRGNGVSVLIARDAVGENPFLLSMSDHIVSSSAIERILRHPRENNLLLVDPRVDQIFDIDDATKVEVNGRYILNIGKEIPKYNAIDCGIFVLDQRFFTVMDEQQRSGKESISAGVTKLIEMRLMEAVFMDENDFWIDIDTPESYQFALKEEKYGNHQT
ncbi:hypothetical protein B6D60_11390 [candidate division KSB1 bacterium 4484_87]|nr:MAG: hypothetical protein B6D60_11390 [candidate division KSB1 bacterium 4484_87]